MYDGLSEFHVHSREVEDRAAYARLEPFEDPAHPCPRCGRAHFVYNTLGAFFCQRDGTDMGRLVGRRRVWNP